MSGMVTIEQLQPQIKGLVIEPGHPDYDDDRKVFVGGVDRRPALIVPVADEADVARTVDLARELVTGPGAYANFLADDGAARIHEPYPARTWERFTAIKTR